jgi:hypothetical protein
MIGKFFARVTNKLSSIYWKIRFQAEITRKITIAKKLSKLPDFPSSDSTPEQFITLTLKGSEKTYSLLHSFSNSNKMEIIPLSEWPVSTEEEQTSEKLRELFNQNGSDKGDSHGYHRVYATLIKLSLEKTLEVLEIGLGTNNQDTPSNMGKFGIPGASLRSWRDLDPRIQVVGADIDSRILFHEERIATYEVDQTDQSSWDYFISALGNQSFNLIIDDGLHSPFANLLTVKNLLPKLSPNGYMVIEDVNEVSLPVWDLFVELTKLDTQVRIVRANKAHLVILNKK